MIPRWKHYREGMEPEAGGDYVRVSDLPAAFIRDQIEPLPPPLEDWELDDEDPPETSRG